MTISKPVIAALLSCVFISLPSGAIARDRDECDVRFSQESATITMLASNIGEGQRAVGEQLVRVVANENDGPNSACRVDLRVSRLTSDPAFPAYRLVILGRPLEPTLNETVIGTQNQIALSVPSNRTGRSVSLQAAAASDWGVRSGRHNEQLQLSLVGPDGEIIDRLALNLVLDIPKAVDVMFVGATGTGRTSRIDLGNLSATEPTRSEPFGLRVWSSSGYRVEISSENGGNLGHRLGMDAIPYRLEIDGRDVALGNTATPFSRPDATGRTGDLFRVGILVPARRSVAGRYQDRITVSVSSI